MGYYYNRYHRRNRKYRGRMTIVDGIKRYNVKRVTYRNVPSGYGGTRRVAHIEYN